MLDDVSSARLDAWRQRWFPPERSFLAAHLTLFHALPEDDAVLALVQQACAKEERMPVRFARLEKSTRSILVRAEAPVVRRLHDALGRDLVTRFAERVTNQDRQRLVPHVTLVNKANPEHVALATAAIEAAFAPWDGTGDGIAVWRYEGGPWSPVARFAFA